MKQRLWIVSELFYPDETSTAYIVTEIAKAMVSKYDVCVICGPEGYDQHKNPDLMNAATLDGAISLYRTEVPVFSKDVVTGKALRFLLVSVCLFHLARKNIKAGDKVFMVTNPAPMVVLTSWLKKRRGFELTILVHDVFPENTKAARLNVPGAIYKFLKQLFDKAYSRADRLVVLGRDMRSILENKVSRYSNNVKFEVIANWADINAIENLGRDHSRLKIPKDKVVLEYAGNMGRVQGLHNLLSILKEVNNKDFEFSFWGTGAEEKNLKRYAVENNLVNVKFNGAYTRRQQNMVLNSCDLALVTLAEHMYGLGVPSKTYNILASGRPILFIGNTESEIALLVGENNIGFCFEPSERVRISAFLESLNPDQLPELRAMGHRARLLAESVYSKQTILKRFTDTI